MSRHAASLRTHARISDLCPVFSARLHPMWEEGVPLHQPHTRPCFLDLDDRGRVRPATDQRIAIICEVDRTSPLLLHMEESLHAVCPKPRETLLLELPVGDGTRLIRARLLKEASDLCSEFMEQGQEVGVVAVSHRRTIHGSLLLRHHLVALFGHLGTLCWCHPAAAGYGLIRPGFPSRQRIRRLGRTGLKMTPEEIPRRLDEGTGLPAWFLFAREILRKRSPDEACDFASVLQVLGELWVAHGMATDPGHAMRLATQDYFQGFETFFGMGGLQPTPTILFP